MATLPLLEVRPPAPAPEGASAAPAPGGPADVVFVLLLLQAAMGLLATLGLTVIMGVNLVYALVPSIKPILLLVLARRLVRGRRGAVAFIIAIEAVSLAGYALNLLVGFAPQVDVTVNLITVLSNVALPMAILVLCAGLRPRVGAA